MIQVLRVTRYADVHLWSVECFTAALSGLECRALDAFWRNRRNIEETPLSKIARRKFIQLSAVATAGVLVQPGREARAEDMPHLSEDDPMAQGMKYTHDANTVDPASRPNSAADQTCANCALVQGNDGDAWRPCQIFPGKLVNADGWCTVWAPKT
jgi:hypothetical protein